MKQLLNFALAFILLLCFTQCATAQKSKYNREIYTETLFQDGMKMRFTTLVQDEGLDTEMQAVLGAKIDITCEDLTTNTSVINSEEQTTVKATLLFQNRDTLSSVIVVDTNNSISDFGAILESDTVFVMLSEKQRWNMELLFLFMTQQQKMLKQLLKEGNR